MDEARSTMDDITGERREGDKWNSWLNCAILARKGKVGEWGWYLIGLGGSGRKINRFSGKYHHQLFVPLVLTAQQYRPVNLVSIYLNVYMYMPHRSRP